MIRGRVVGELWATRKASGLQGRKLVFVVELDGSVPTDRVVVAIDTIEARVGQDVLVTFGSGARTAISPTDREVLGDAAIGMLVDADEEGEG